MHKTDIEWCDYATNPITGCLRDCKIDGKPWCYAKRFAARGLGKGKAKATAESKRFEPEFHPDRLELPAAVKKPSRVFVCSMADAFGPWVPESWIRRVVDMAKKCPWHTFIFLSKYPRRLATIDWPDNAWVGTTVTDQRSMDMANRPMAMTQAPVRFISVEPMIGHVVIDLEWIPDWVIIGPMTGPGAVPIPDGAAAALTEQCVLADVPVFHKAPMGLAVLLEQYPKEKSDG